MSAKEHVEVLHRHACVGDVLHKCIKMTVSKQKLHNSGGIIFDNKNVRVPVGLASFPRTSEAAKTFCPGCASCNRQLPAKKNEKK